MAVGLADTGRKVSGSTRGKGLLYTVFIKYILVLELEIC